MVEFLGVADRKEGARVLTQAFATHPAFAPGTPLTTVAALLKLFFDKFGRPGQAFLHGIRQNGRLACVALSLDLRNEPGGLDLLGFFYKFWRIMGLARLLEFVRGYVGRPRHKRPYLELFLLGTAPGSQQRGLGREMLRFLYELARDKGFAGVVLTAARRAPACGFYLREGFAIEAEIWFRGEPMVHMRRDNQDA